MGFVSWQRYCTASSSGRQPNFAALNRGRHLCSAGRPSGWALAHILVVFLSGRQRTGALCAQHSPTAAALSTNTAFELKYDFCVSPFCQVVQKHKLFEVAY